MIKFKIIMQEALKIAILFLFVFVWIRFFVRKLSISLLITTLLTIAFELLFLFISKKISKSSSLKLKEKQDAENMFFSLANTNNQGLFLKKLARENAQVEKVSLHHVVFKKQGDRLLMYFVDNIEGLDCQKLFEIVKKFNSESINKILILCKQIKDKQVYSFLNLFDGKVVVFDEYQTYQNLYKKHQIFPEITNKLPSAKKQTLKTLIAYSFNKKRTKGYLFSAFVLILSSIFVKTTIYYCLISTILLLFAMFSYFNPQFNKKEQSII